MHYSFKDGVIQEHSHWEYAFLRGEGTFTYSDPEDVIAPWTKLVASDFVGQLTWERRTKETVPKEFLAALLLLGVPI